MKGIGNNALLHLFTEQIKEINELISADLFFLDKLEEVLFRAAGFVNASSGLVTLHFNKKNYFHSFGFSQDQIELIHSKPKTILSSDLLKPILGKNLVDSISIPLITQYKTVGELLFVNKESRKGTASFEELDRSLITVVAQQISLALERLNHITLQKDLLNLNQSILNSTSSAIVATDKDLNVLLANEKAQIWFNQTDEKANLLDFIPVNSQVRQFIVEFLNKRTPMAAESLVLSATNPRLLKIYASPISTVNQLSNDKSGFIFSFDDVTEFKKLKDTFSRYVSKDVLNHLIYQKGNLRLGGYKRSCAIFFSDIRGFTSYSEKNEPEEVVETLNQYFNVMISCINDEDGEVDKLVGDEIMAVFNEIPDKAHPCIRAVRAALKMRASLELFNQMRTEEALQPLFFGVGINYGEVICGNIGSFDRMDYTVIGDNVNVAARLCSTARQDEILISQSTETYLENQFSLETLKPISVKGKVKPISIFQVKA